MVSKNKSSDGPVLQVVEDEAEKVAVFGGLGDRTNPDSVSRPVPPSIGVVIVNYNSGRYLKRCLVSLLKSEVGLRIVVVDNSSDDDSLKGVHSGQLRHHRLELVKNEDNLGFSTAVNVGARNVESDYIMLLNPDAMINAKTLSGLRDELEARPSAGIAGPIVFNADGTEQRGCRRNDPTLVRSVVTTLGLERRFEGVNRNHELLPPHTESVDAVSGSAMMIRRDVFDELNGMDESYFLHCEDLDICRRSRDIGYDVLFCPAYSVFHQQGASGNVSSLTVESYKHEGMLTYYENHQASRDNLPLQWLNKALVRASLARFRLSSWFGEFRRAGESELDQNNDSGLLVEDVVSGTKNDAKPGRGRTVLLTGAKSDVGDHLIKLLTKCGYDIVAVSRTVQKPVDSKTNSVRWMSAEYFEKSPQPEEIKIDYWINLAPIWTTRAFGRLFRKLKPRRLLAVSSSSLHSKSESTSRRDQKLVKSLKAGERYAEKLADQLECSAVIFRPTMIYGGPRNQNINFISDFVRWFRFFPLLGRGDGLRQPVHSHDVALACLYAIQTTKLWRSQPSVKTFELGGLEKISYRKMVERVFQSQQRKARFLPVPLWLIKSVLTLTEKIPGLDFVTSGAADRLQQDLVFDNEPAREAFGYSPGKFVP
ncbi:MAG: glycosyltransferase [Pseudomonadota bacterium]